MSNLVKELDKIKSGVIAVLCENTNDLDSILKLIEYYKDYNNLVVFDPDNLNKDYQDSDKLGEYIFVYLKNVYCRFANFEDFHSPPLKLS